MTLRRALQQLFLIGAMCFLSSVITAQSSSTVITLPVSGSIVESPSRTEAVTVKINTSSGHEKSFEYVLSPYTLEWSPDGLKIAGHISGIMDRHQIGYYNLNENTAFTQDTGLEGSYPVYNPIGWTSDSQQIVYQVYSISSDFQEQFYSFYSYDIVAKTFQLIEEYRTGQTENVPVIEPLSNKVFLNVYFASINPVYNEWVAVSASVGEKEDTDDGTAYRGESINYLWNIQSGNVISIQSLLDSLQFTDAHTFSWHPDGKTLLIANSGQLPHPENKQIILVNFTSDGAVSLQKNIIPPDPFDYVEWLGVRDLLIVRQYDAANDQQIYSIAQSIENQWYQTEFFRRVSSGSLYGSAWRLEADETERYTLSCIFDRALSSQLQTGQQAVVSSSTSLNLQSSPFDTTTQITQVANGEIVDIIGVNACTDDLRFWNVHTASGDEGWLPEADTQQYFLNPL
ncbi:MAG: hypothetical protein ACPG7F_06110 [Aggregatilineales bacterium]